MSVATWHLRPGAPLVGASANGPRSSWPALQAVRSRHAGLHHPARAGPSQRCIVHRANREAWPWTGHLGKDTRKINMTIVYKVVRKCGEKLVSVAADEPPYMLIYSTDEWTYPTLGRILAFDTWQAAVFFRVQYMHQLC